MAALRAAVFPLSAKNRRGGHFFAPPPPPVRVLKNHFIKLSNSGLITGLIGRASPIKHYAMFLARTGPIKMQYSWWRVAFYVIVISFHCH